MMVGAGDEDCGWTILMDGTLLMVLGSGRGMIDVGVGREAGGLRQDTVDGGLR